MWEDPPAGLNRVKVKMYFLFVPSLARHTDLNNLGQGPFSSRLNQDIQILELSTFSGH